jgi:FtsH-binding integral membrane protein
MSSNDQNTALSGAIGSDAIAVDAGLRSYMLRIYNYMAAGVSLTALVAWLTYQLTGPALLQSPLMWIFILAPLALVFFISSRIQTLSATMARWLFFVYAALVGVSLSTLLHIYASSSRACSSSQPRRSVLSAFLGIPSGETYPGWAPSSSWG